MKTAALQQTKARTRTTNPMGAATEMDEQAKPPVTRRARLRAWAVERRKPLTTLAFAMLGFGACSAGVATAAWTRACAGGCPTAAQIADFAPAQASVVYDARGGLLAMFYHERRQVVSLKTLPRHVPLAFVAIEDRRYFDHEGVDALRLLGAVRDNVLDGFGASGASTITMQLARNLFPQQLPMREKSIRRKVAEVRLALAMERRFSKRRILELYLNHIYLGAGAYGIEAAAKTYFNKSAAQLTLGEAATLAALPKAPSYYSPRRNPEAAEARRNLVLAAMAEMGVISPERAQREVGAPLVLSSPIGALNAPYFVEEVRREMERKFGDLLYTGGLRIYTTLDPTLQNAAEQALETHLREVENGKFGYFPHVSYEKFTARRKDPSTNLSATPYLQGVVVAMDPNTADVLALVGGRDFRQSQFNRATQALRQPGSAFKPFVYAAGLEHGRSPNFRVSDAPITLGNWSPRNYGGDYGGMTTLRQALKMSRNMVAIRLGRQVGIDNVRNLARRVGLETEIPGYAPVYLGAASVYPLDLIASYAAFGNGGVRVEPHFVRRVDDPRGKLLWTPAPVQKPALDPGVAWLLTDMLREVVDHGTGYNARNPAVGNLPYDIPAAGKTGTTNDATDVWFVGYTPDLLAGVWLGFDRPKRIMAGATGGSFAVPVWAEVVRTYYQNHDKPPAWPRPHTLVARRITPWNGKAVTADCPYAGGAYTDYFAASVAPVPGCDAPPEPTFVDPTPELPGRPVFPGQPRVPQTIIQSVRVPQ